MRSGISKIWTIETDPDSPPLKMSDLTGCHDKIPLLVSNSKLRLPHSRKPAALFFSNMPLTRSMVSDEDSVRLRLIGCVLSNATLLSCQTPSLPTQPGSSCLGGFFTPGGGGSSPGPGAPPPPPFGGPPPPPPPRGSPLERHLVFWHELGSGLLSHVCVCVICLV